MTNYTEHDALIVFGPTPNAVLSPGTGSVSESWEHAAALYESYAADNEWNNGETAATPGVDNLVAYGVALKSLGSYCTAAERVADSTWEDDLRSLGVDEDTFDE